MSSNTKQIQDVDPAQWVFQPPTEARSGRGKTVYINASPANGRNPSFQMPKCRVPWGADPGLEPRPENTRWNMELSVDDEELQTFLHKIDDVALNWLVKNSVACFGKETSRLVLDDAGMYRKVVQPSKQGGYAPLCRTKVIIGRAGDNNSAVRKSKNNMTNVLIVTKEENGEVLEYMPGTKDDLTPNSIVVPRVEVGGMWFISGKCGMSFVVTDVLVWPAEKQEEFPFSFGGGGSNTRPKKVARMSRREFDPFDMETTMVNMPPTLANGNDRRDEPKIDEGGEEDEDDASNTSK